jgi:Heavy metal associated domain 2
MRYEPASTVVHQLPRRVRLRASLLVGHREICERIAEKFMRNEATSTRVEIRPSTGSVIVERDDGTLNADELRTLLAQLVTEEMAAVPSSRRFPVPDKMPGPTRVANTVARAFVEINGDVRRALDGRADLGTILPVVFFSLGLVEVAATRKLPAPAWFNLLWWSLRSFMTFNPMATGADVRSSESGPRREVDLD